MDEFFAPVSNLALIFKFPGNMLTISTQPTVCLSTAKARWDGLVTKKTLNSVIAKNLFFISFTHSAWNCTIAIIQGKTVIAFILAIFEITNWVTVAGTVINQIKRLKLIYSPPDGWRAGNKRITTRLSFTTTTLFSFQDMQIAPGNILLQARPFARRHREMQYQIIFFRPGNLYLTRGSMLSSSRFW